MGSSRRSSCSPRYTSRRAADPDGRGRPLGRLLVGRGWLTEADLARCVEEQCIEVLARVLVARDGVFLYVDGVTAPANLAVVPLDADRVLAEATRRTDDLRALRGLLPTPTAPLLVTPRIAEAMDDLTMVEVQVAKTLRGGLLLGGSEPGLRRTS